MRYFLCTCDDADLIQRPHVGTETAVNTQHAAVDDGGEIEVVENLAAALPNIGVAVLALALVVEAVDLGDLSALVVAAKQRDARRMSRLEGHEQRKRLQAKVASVHKVALYMYDR